MSRIKCLVSSFMLFNLCCGAISGPCARRYYPDKYKTELKSFVCVCNASYCDQIGKVDYPTASDSYTVYETSKDGLRLTKRTGTMLNARNETTADVSVKIDPAKKFQTIFGFGGAFTDSAAINFKKLGDSKLMKALIESYYSEDGIKYNIGRIPMASCDFSTHEYSYDDVPGDFNLSHFKLAPEDLFGKIPMIKAAQDASREQILFFGSPWSAPGWMKTNGRMAAGGALRGQPGSPYFKTWAQYFVKFIEEYQKHNISIWGVTAQNEPTNIPLFTKFQQMHFTPQIMRDFIKKDLGPALNSSGLSGVKLMIVDDERLFLPLWTSVILSDADARKYVSGIAVHWYLDGFVPADILTTVHQKYPDLFILPSEACQGSHPYDLEKVSLGSWTRAESYAQDIIQDLNNYAIGWIDWNLDLDPIGGPNWVDNFVDSPIIVNKTQNGAEFLKQPMYYALGHFSKFMSRGSSRIYSYVSGDGVEGVAFRTNTGYVGLVLLNKNDHTVSVNIETVMSSYAILDAMSARSMQTYIWKLQSF